jgi:hypothetical protein
VEEIQVFRGMAMEGFVDKNRDIVFASIFNGHPIKRFI